MVLRLFLLSLGLSFFLRLFSEGLGLLSFSRGLFFFILPFLNLIFLSCLDGFLILPHGFFNLLVELVECLIDRTFYRSLLSLYV